MREVTIVILIGLCGFLSFKVYRQNQTIARLGGDTRAEVERTDLTSKGTGKSAQVPTPETVGNEDRPFNQYFDAEKAFARDELFAVTSKQIVPAQKYVDRFEKSSLGTPKEKSHPPVYGLRCLGRETRENYLFIVDRSFHDAAQMNQKFTKQEMSNWEFFLSEDRMHQKIFHRRFRNKMID